MRVLHGGPIVARQRDIPKAIRALDVLPSDYVDVFTGAASKASLTPAEQWARAALDAASPLGRFLAWRALLGLRLESGTSAEHVAGWRIAEQTHSWIRLEASSAFMTANIVFQIDEDQVSFATLIRYDSPVARLIWTPVSAIHRQIAPDVLSAAIRRVSRTR